MPLFPREKWDRLGHTLIWHGRRVCFAQKPDCAHCPLNGTDGFEHPCPCAFKAEKVGRKPPRKRVKVRAKPKKAKR
jgi:endonuclease-3